VVAVQSFLEVGDRETGAIPRFKAERQGAENNGIQWLTPRRLPRGPHSPIEPVCKQGSIVRGAVVVLAGGNVAAAARNDRSAHARAMIDLRRLSRRTAPLFQLDSS